MSYTLQFKSEISSFPTLVHNSTSKGSKIASRLGVGFILLFLGLMLSFLFFVFDFIFEGIDLTDFLLLAVGLICFFISIPGLQTPSRLPDALVLDTDQRRVKLLNSLSDPIEHAPSFSFDDVQTLECHRQAHVKRSNPKHTNRAPIRVLWYVTLRKKDGADWTITSFLNREKALQYAEQLNHIFQGPSFSTRSPKSTLVEGQESEAEESSSTTLEFDLEHLELQKTQWQIGSKPDSFFSSSLNLNKQEETIGPFSVQKQLDQILISWFPHRSMSRVVSSFLFALGSALIAIGLSQIGGFIAWIGVFIFSLMSLVCFWGMAQVKKQRWIRITVNELRGTHPMTPLAPKNVFEVPLSKIYSVFFNLGSEPILRIPTHQQYKEFEQWKETMKTDEIELQELIEGRTLQQRMVSVDLSTLKLEEILILEKLIEDGIQVMSGHIVL